MTNHHSTEMQNPQLSLQDLVGRDYVESVCRARAWVTGEPYEQLASLATEPVDFAPSWYRERLDDLVDVIGQKVCDGLGQSARGAGTEAINAATMTSTAPLTGFGFIRIGEDGKAYLASKSEHYHAPLGHSFPGYALLERAARLGIPNATHNNTRGHITRLLEEELIRAANGIAKDDGAGLRAVLATSEPHVLNRVINLETGSLAVEAALKMMLARFYRLEETFPAPPYAGRTPVFLVMGDFAGGSKANYHGTTILTQVLRDMWPQFGEGLAHTDVPAHDGLPAQAPLFIFKPVRINDIDQFTQMVETYDGGTTKVAGFFHEIVLMNYGGIRLKERYLQQAYRLCHERDVPIIVDEIQSCLWSPDLFMYREYGLQPDFVSIGKGFPGGQYPASKILTTTTMDNLNQFGALVTNGQEELASLAYLVTMAFAEANRDYTEAIGTYYELKLAALARKYETVIDRVEGRRHLSSIFFHRVETAVAFTRQLTAVGIDISAHTYKAQCPPAALTKIPLISTYRMVDFLIRRMDEALWQLRI